MGRGDNMKRMDDKQLKQFIVCGASTGGKSTFSTELVKEFAVQHICIDPIINAFEDVFPQLGITHKAPTHAAHIAVCEKFRPFAERMIDSMDVDNFVFEGFRLPIADLYKKYKDTSIQFFVFGYPSATPQDKLAQIREHDNGQGNWVDEMANDELIETLTFLIAESKEEEKVRRDLAIPFFDTSKEYWEKIHEALNLVRK